MIKNHQAAGVDPAVDREHESWFSMAAQPALGWVRGLDIGPASVDKRRSALVAHVELNDLGVAAVKNKHFRYVSMGFDKAGKHRLTNEPIGAVLDHLALVKNPFIQGMRPLSLALSSQLGRMVDGDPMEQLANRLRTELSLSADAPEEDILAALEQRRRKAESDAAESTAAHELALADVAKLAERLGAIETERWSQLVAAAVSDFRLTPAEGEAYAKLTGVERATAARLMALRVANRPAPPVVAVANTPTTKGTTDEGLTASQAAAVEAYKKLNPGVDDMSALMGAMSAAPTLFSTEELTNARL